MNDSTADLNLFLILGAEAFSMRVIYHNRNKLSEELAAGAKYVSFEELLSTSDVISLNLPLNVSGPCLSWSFTTTEMQGSLLSLELTTTE